MTTVKTFCRNCTGVCGLEIDVVDERITAVRPDRTHPITRGYHCVKAGMSVDLANGAGEDAALVQGPRSLVMAATGAAMGPHSNLVFHLVECLNLLCSAVRRVGDKVANPGVLMPRPWEQEPKGRHSGAGRLFGEFPTPPCPMKFWASPTAATAISACAPISSGAATRSNHWANRPRPGEPFSGQLVSLEADIQSFNRMPVQTGLPLRVSLWSR